MQQPLFTVTMALPFAMQSESQRRENNGGTKSNTAKMFTNDALVIFRRQRAEREFAHHQHPRHRLLLGIVDEQWMQEAIYGVPTRQPNILHRHEVKCVCVVRLSPNWVRVDMVWARSGTVSARPKPTRTMTPNWSNTVKQMKRDSDLTWPKRTDARIPRSNCDVIDPNLRLAWYEADKLSLSAAFGIVSYVKALVLCLEARPRT